MWIGLVDIHRKHSRTDPLRSTGWMSDSWVHSRAISLSPMCPGSRKVGICGVMVSTLRNIVTWKHSSLTRDRHDERSDRVIRAFGYNPDQFRSMWDYHRHSRKWMNSHSDPLRLETLCPRKSFWSMCGQFLQDSPMQRCTAGYMVSMYGHEFSKRKTYHNSSVGVRRFTVHRIPITGIDTHRPDDSHDGKEWSILSVSESLCVPPCCMCTSTEGARRGVDGWSMRRSPHMSDETFRSRDSERIGQFVSIPSGPLWIFHLTSHLKKTGFLPDLCGIAFVLDEGCIFRL